MRRVSVVLWLLGVLCVVALILYVDSAKVVGALAGVGPGAAAAIVVFQLAPITADSLSWRLVVPAEHRPSVAGAMRVRWYGESVKAVMPVAPVAAELVRVRAAVLYRVPAAVAAASTVVDFTLGIAGQVAFTVAGLAALAWQEAGGAESLVPTTAAGSALLALLLAVFWCAQRSGLFRVAVRGLARRFGGAEQIDALIAATYRRRSILMRAFSLRTFSWFLGTLEVWLVLRFLGHPISLADALILESVGYGVRAAAFVIPGALGAQEAAFILLGSVVGLDAEIGLALSLVKRGRELAVALPGLLAWQAAEGARFWRRTTSR